MPLDGLLHESEALIMKGIKKYFGTLKAVDGLTLGIKDGE